MTLGARTFRQKLLVESPGPTFLHELAQFIYMHLKSSIFQKRGANIVLRITIAPNTTQRSQQIHENLLQKEHFSCTALRSAIAFLSSRARLRSK